MSATACVSAADPDRQHHILPWICVNLSVTRLAMYVPVVVLESAPKITPSWKVTAMIDVPIETSPFFKCVMSTFIESILPIGFSSALLHSLPIRSNPQPPFWDPLLLLLSCARPQEAVCHPGLSVCRFCEGVPPIPVHGRAAGEGPVMNLRPLAKIFHQLGSKQRKNRG